MAPREYYKQSGEPENESVRRSLEKTEVSESVEPFHIEGEYNESTFKKEWVERVKETLEQVDFTLLRKIISGIAERCGISDERLNFLDKNRICLSERKNGREDDKYTSGSYRILSNLIDIYPHNLVFSLYVLSLRKKSVTVSAEKLVLSDEMLQFGVLGTLIHEQVHAISFTRIISGYPKSFWKRLAMRVVEGTGVMIGLSGIFSGYQRNFVKRDAKGDYQTNRDFVAFDEGVTEKLAFEILGEYLSAVGSNVTNKKQAERLQEDMQNTTFGLCTQLVDQMINNISRKVGIDKKSVWQAVVRSKLEGVDLGDTEIAQCIDESTFDGFFAKLKKLQPKDIRDAEELQTCLNQ